MKRNILCLVSCVFLVNCTQEMPDIQNLPIKEKPVLTKSPDTEASYYYSSAGERIYLTESPDHLFVIFNSSLLTESASSPSTIMSNILGDEVPQYSFVIDSQLISECLCAKITHETADLYKGHVLYSAPYYITPEGAEIGLTNIFRIQLFDSDDIDALEEFAEANNVKIIKSNMIPLWYTLSCTDTSTKNALELANQAYESGLFAACDIEFTDAINIESNLYTYNDPRYEYQWNLHSSSGFGLGMDNVHFITKGHAASIAVVDNGINLGHPDLSVTSSWDATSGTVPAKNYSYKTNEVNHHGTATTGLIGAQINNVGIAGIAPSSSLIPISVQFNSSSTTENLTNAIYYAANNGADVISNSWSSNKDIPILNSAISYALSSGRNGKGAVIVFASGNQSQSSSRYPHASNPNIISVGNIDSLGIRYPTSNYGPDLDIVAPGTDMELLSGDGDYINASGTSLSCPQVAAIAGLMLSENPELTNLQVSEIINKTAVRISTYTFTDNSERPHGLWNNEVGYGLVNAMDAVSLAKGYYNLISFDYTGSTVEFSVTADKDIAIIWDWETEDITEVPLISSTTRTFTHTYGTNKKRRIYIAEKIDLETDPIPVNSTALTEFVLTSGEDASDVEVKPRNTALEYIRIVGGADIASQTVSIKDLPSLKDLYLVHMPDVAVEIRNCPELLRFGSSNYIWGGPPELSNPDLPMFPVEGELLGPDNVNGGTAGAVWPDVPEPIQSFSSLSIEGCDSLKDVSLENVGITNFDFSGLPSLRYLYVSSQDDMIVGGTDGSYTLLTKGRYLADSICTLPDRSGQSTKGWIRVRGVSQTNTEYVEATVSPLNKTIISRFCDNNHWQIIWDSGVTDSAL